MIDTDHINDDLYDPKGSLLIKLPGFVTIVKYRSTEHKLNNKPLISKLEYCINVKNLQVEIIKNDKQQFKMGYFI